MSTLPADLEVRYAHRRPRDDAFSTQVGASAADAPARESWPLGPAGAVVAVEGGDLLTIELVDGPQIVHLFAWNPDDPDERIWPHETSGIEDAFLRPGSRIWSTMARFRPLLTVVVDTVVAADAPGGAIGRHHFVLSGSETPARWRAEGGRPGEPTPWVRFRDLLTAAGVDPALHRDHVSFFRKIAVDVVTHRFVELRSDARAGDRVVLFAEVPLRVALVPSPWREGGSPAASVDAPPRPVTVTVAPSGVAPRSWPPPGVPYPDLGAYVDASGHRT